MDQPDDDEVIFMLDLDEFKRKLKIQLRRIIERHPVSRINEAAHGIGGSVRFVCDDES